MSRADAPSTSREVLGRGSIYTLGTAGPILAAIFITPLLVSQLSVVEYDKYTLNLMAMNVGIGLMALGLPQVVTRNYLTDSEGPEKGRGLALQGSLAALALGLIIGLVMFFVPQSNLLWYVAACSGLGGGLAIMQSLAVARRNPGVFLAQAIGQTLGGQLLGLLSVRLISTTAGSYFGGVALAYLLLFLVLVGWVRSLGPVQITLSGFLAALRMSLPIVPHQLAVGSVTALAVFIAASLMGVGAPSVVQLGTLVGTAPLVIISSLSYAWLPAMLSLPVDQRSAGIETSCRSVAWLAAFGAGSLALLSPWFLMFLNQGGKHDLSLMVPVTCVVCVSACLAAPYQGHMQLILASGRTPALAIMTPLAVALGALAAWLGAMQFGVVGVALGYPVTYLLLWLFAKWLSAQVATTRWQDAVAVPPVLLCIGLAVLGAVLPWTNSWGMGLRLGGAAIGLLAALRILLLTVRPPTAG